MNRHKDNERIEDKSLHEGIEFDDRNEAVVKVLNFSAIYDIAKINTYSNKKIIELYNK